MGSILHEQDMVEQWRSLLQDSQSRAFICLEKELENYLLFLLIRFINKPEIIEYDLKLNFLVIRYENALYLHKPHYKKLQSIGDHCLLFSGLFPGYIEHSGSSLSHIVKIGKNAYHWLANRNPLYHHLSHCFTQLMDVLLHLKDPHDAKLINMPQALDLWENTHSQYAYEFLRTHKKTSH